MSLPENPVVIYGNGIGDTLLTLPTIRALAEIHHGALTLVCRKRDVELCFAEVPVRRHIFIKMWVDKGTRQFDAAALASTLDGCDMLYSPVTWFSESMVQLIDHLAPTRSIGFYPWFARHIPLNVNRHMVDMAFDIVREASKTADVSRYTNPPTFPSKSIALARRLTSLFGAEQRILAVHCDTTPKKMWGKDHWVCTLNQFLRRHRDFTAIVIEQVPSDIKQGECADRIVCVNHLPLTAVCAIVSQADMFVGVDSCMLHVADLFRIPSVGLFGPTDPQRWGFRFAPHAVIRGEGRVMDAISIDNVTTTMEEVATWAKMPNRRYPSHNLQTRV